MKASDISASIYAQFEKLRAVMKNSGLRMLPPLVDIVGESVVRDLGRFESFHESDNSEVHKQAAFLVYWISKLKPIAILPFHRHDKYITINESFAFTLAMQLLGINFSARISIDFEEDFVYSLCYRDTSPRQMFYTFMMLDRLNKAIPASEQII
ncbi:MAG: hypothetical protein LBC63_00895 [Holophagales bacterium]|jgi:hypothetical protein|nr:hypothetical protein [Holophagales bacterium]